MNYLSKLLYWADVCGHFRPVIGGLGLIFFIITLMMLCFHLDDTNQDQDKKLSKKLGIRFGIASFFCIAASIFTPSKDTMYAIAASEVGEQVLKSPIVGKAEKALETWLDKQINTTK